MTIAEKIKLLERRSERVVSVEELAKRMEMSEKTGKPLRIKLGMDPTAPDVTLGHCVPLKIVRQFQDWGHKAVLIIGDYTARVGDPTGRNALRPKLDGAAIDANAKTYVAQVGKILRTDPEALEVRFNGEWLGKMSMIDVIELLAKKTVDQLLTRDDFSKRFAEKSPIYLHELFYPLLQGWDSVVIDADIELGGNDQLFNNLVGRELQQDASKPGQLVIVTPLLVGTDGVAKMSKSKGNYIGVTDPAGGNNGMFGKLMRVPDALLESYYTLLTDEPLEQVRHEIAANPRDAKVKLARLVISWLHSEADFEKAYKDFMTATHGGVPDDVPVFELEKGPHKLAPLLVKVGFVPSNSEANRKLKEGSIKLDGEKIPLDKINEPLVVEKECVIQMGSRRFAKLKPI
jgi:tyrosyl-tRNA synthetase